MSDDARKQLDDLVVSYGRMAGRVYQGSLGGYHFSASKDHVSVCVAQDVFERLVSNGRINCDGTVPSPERTE